MRKLFFLPLLCLGLFGQTSNYPGALDNDRSLFVVSDNVQSTLSAAVGTSDVTWKVSSSTGFAANMIATICDVIDSTGKCTAFEHALVTAVNGNDLTVTRGFAGTAPRAHASKKTVAVLIDAAHQQALKDAIIKIQTALGPQLANVNGRVSTAFDFSPQTPGGSLVPGNNSITLTPVPNGVNGSDTQHYLYVSGGTGTAESCLITGGPATAGQSSGSIIISCAGAHSGAWAIKSASAGIKEASVALGGQGTVTVPSGDATLYAPLVLPTAVSLIGAGSTTYVGPKGTRLIAASGVSPALVVGDGNGTAAGQGAGVHSGYTLYGAGSGTGLWIGGDPASVFAPASWYGSHTRFENIVVNNFATALNFQSGNFVTFRSAIFSGLTRALVIPSTAAYGGAGNQPVSFYDCVLTVPTGAAVDMNQTSYQTSPVEFIGGQISGAITGSDIFWESNDTHYEPNQANAGWLTVTSGAAIVKITGGIMSVHGTSLSSAIAVSGTGVYVVIIKDVQAQSDVGMTVTNFCSFQTSTGGKLVLENIHIAAAGVFSNLYSVSKATLDASTTLYVSNPVSEASVNIAAGATVTFPPNSYPGGKPVTIVGGTIGGGITAVAGLTAYSHGILRTTSAQTFTAGATIGNTFTTVANLPYRFYFDGTKIWIN